MVRFRPPRRAFFNTSFNPISITGGALVGIVFIVYTIAGCARANAPATPQPVANEPEAKAIPTATPLIVATPTPTPDPYGIPRRLPGPTTRRYVSDARIAALEAKNAKYPTFDAYRRMAELHVQLGNFGAAARNYRTEAAMYRKKGDINAAIIEELKASRYETSVRLFLDREIGPAESNTLYSGAPLEPAVGCYLGAFIDRDEQLRETFVDENWQTHRRADEFARVTGKAHASYFMYVSYGQKFPRRWVQHCKDANVIPHIAWEPRSLAAVKDDVYLQNWAKELGAMDWPIFVRYASEMNGEWTPYHGNPRLYIEKFRLVNRVLHHYAPRVATIWCVNNPPLNNVQDYYPGDAHCDWVGVNLYSVPFYDNRPERPADQDSPLALLDPIYNMFAARKPIAICEYAASHMAAADRKPRNDFAINKLSLLYSALPRLYPRVKLIDWFDMDNLRNAQPGRQLNNYNLTEQPDILRAYRGVVSAPYYLERPTLLSDPRPAMPRPLQPNQTVRGMARFSVWVKTYTPRPKVYLQIGGRIVHASAGPGARVAEFDLRKLKPGSYPVMAFVFDERNRFIAKTSTTINTR